MPSACRCFVAKRASPLASNRCALPITSTTCALSAFEKLARWRQIEHLDAVIANVVTRRREDGEVEVDQLLTEDGQHLRFDFYIDCTGFRSLLWNRRWVRHSTAMAAACTAIARPWPMSRTTEPSSRTPAPKP